MTFTDTLALMKKSRCLKVALMTDNNNNNNNTCNNNL